MQTLVIFLGLFGWGIEEAVMLIAGLGVLILIIYSVYKAGIKKGRLIEIERRYDENG